MTASRGTAPADTFWMGAHKTGTTFLQKSLDLSQPALQAAGVQYIELGEFRRLYTRPLLNDGHPDPVDAAPTASGRRLIFDENIIGLVQHALCSAGLYPKAARRALRVADHLGLVQPRIVLGLRGFRGFLPSLYCEALKSTEFSRFRKFCITPEQALSWDDLIGRLAAVFPHSEILIYTAEALRGREKALLSVVTGLTPEALSLLGQAERPGFSQKAVRALHELAKTRPVTRQDVIQQNQLHPRGAKTPGFDPWKPDEAARLDEIYAADLARLLQRPQVRFLDPELAVK